MEYVIHPRDITPVHKKPYQIPYLQRELVRKEIDNKVKIVQPSANAWASPIALAPKRDGSSYIACSCKRALLNKVESIL